MITTHIDGRSELLTDYKSLQRKRRVNGEYSLSFLLLETERNEHSFPLTVEESLIDYDGQQYRIKKMTEKTIGNTPVKQIQADHIFFDLVDDYQYETISGAKSLVACLDHALIGTGYTFEVIDAFSSVTFENYGDDNALSLVQIALNRFGAEVDINNKHLKFYRQIGRKTDIQFRYKHNIKTIEKFVDSSNLSTYIKGFGKQNEDGSYVVTAEYTSPLAAYYGIRHAKPVHDERYTTLDGLQERLVNDLQDVPDISFTLDVAELKKAGIITEQLMLGDEIYVIYEPLNIDIIARVMEIVDNPEEPSSSQITLANFRSSIIDSIADFQRTKDTVDALMDGKSKLPFSAMNDAIMRATINLLSAETELEFADGIIARDPRDPNRLLLITSTGIGISTDGGASFKEAITADGFVLSAGVIGFLTANNIKVDYLSAISADLGTVTAGLLTGITIQTDTNPNNPRMVLSKDKLIAQNGQQRIEIAATGAVDRPQLLFTNESAYYTSVGLNQVGALTIISAGNDMAFNAREVVINSQSYPFKVNSNALVVRDLNVQGTKNASVPTTHGYVNVSAYETAEYYFGDIGRGLVVDGQCTINIESLFKETVNTNIDYEVFLTPYGRGLIYVDSMTAGSFTVKGDNIPFGYEIKAKRKGFEDTRLETTYESEVGEVAY